MSTAERGSRPVRIANCSGFYGDLTRAAKDMVEGGPIDVLTGDYLAELTMLILWKTRRRDPAAGYARTFLTQAEQVLGTCLDRGITIVTDAGGLNPLGLGEAVASLATRLGLSPRIACLTGDDLVDRLPALRRDGHAFAHLDTGLTLDERGVEPITANAYLGGWGIAAALEAGADVVVTPRVTDASLVVGPAAWWHGWARTDWDRLAGAVAAGHVIECGPQACGGNYAFLEEVVDRRYPGFPIAEVAANGDSVITKHPGTGGVVSTGTVTAQLLYEIAEPAYVNPDVVSHFETIDLTQQGPDRVLMTGSTGEAPPPTLKVAMNFLGGYRNTMTLVLTGLDIDEKAAWARAELFELLGGEDVFDEVDVRLLRFDHPDAETNAGATAHLQVSVKDQDEALVGRAFSGAVTALALGGYAGFHITTPPTPASSYGVYWPTLVPRDLVEQRLVLWDGRELAVEHSPVEHSPVEDRPLASEPVAPAARPPDGPTVVAPLGRIAGGRSGDKGGNANVGLWARTADEFTWLRAALTVDRFRELVPETAGLVVRRHELPRLRALNFVVVGLLGEGVASATRPDPQAKGLAEYVRSRSLPIPVSLLDAQGAS
ncbi:MAG: acyclic terpene utilization AtuA family protein [Nocardioidaceae bacterium]